MVEAVRTAVQQADVVNMDETGWRQDKQRAWLWTAVTPDLTAFLIDRSRGSTALQALVGEQFAGIVGSDRWSAYGHFPAERRALCYAHLKRDFQALVDRGGAGEPTGRWGLAELASASGGFALWHRFRAGEFDRKALQRRLVPLQARLGRLVWRGEASSDRKVAALCGSLDRWWAVRLRRMDVCAGGRGGAHQQRCGAGAAAGGDRPQGLPVLQESVGGGDLRGLCQRDPHPQPTRPFTH